MLIERWRKKHKQQPDGKEEKQSTEQARRKKMSRAHDKVLEYMLILMDLGGARGFVYGIIPEKGKPVSGASDNLRGWWKEKEMKLYMELHPDAPQLTLHKEAATSSSSSAKYDVDIEDDAFYAGVTDGGLLDDSDDDREERLIALPPNNIKLKQGSQERVVANESQQIPRKNRSVWQNPLQSVVFMDQNSLQQPPIEDSDPAQQQPDAYLNADLQTLSVGLNCLLAMPGVEQSGLQQSALNPNTLLQTPNVGTNCLLPKSSMEQNFLQQPATMNLYPLLQKPAIDTNSSYDQAGQGIEVVRPPRYFPAQTITSESTFKKQPGGFDGNFIYDSPSNFTDPGGSLIRKDDSSWFF
ncbi:hypothetical protein COCNU_12G005600 [Cocos nucifera]|uniref:Ethylene insensitive 3-like DNA-binding domain-containing protein n=1 Tax=Cocos nucifera TaxID=13894 RepID=A0A8K0IRI9_COCNU|nr:hypothetical protein COCNU_12G005600 [Cocos nucifera]